MDTLYIPIFSIMARIGIVARVLLPLSAALVKAESQDVAEIANPPVEVIAHCAAPWIPTSLRVEFGREESTTATAARERDEQGRSNRRKSFPSRSVRNSLPKKAAKLTPPQVCTSKLAHRSRQLTRWTTELTVDCTQSVNSIVPSADVTRMSRRFYSRHSAYRRGSVAATPIWAFLLRPPRSLTGWSDRSTAEFTETSDY